MKPFSSPGDGGLGVRSAASLLLLMLLPSSSPLEYARTVVALAPTLAVAPASATKRSTRREPAPAVVAVAMIAVCVLRRVTTIILIAVACGDYMCYVLFGGFI
jgi:hypothetical protein